MSSAGAETRLKNGILSGGMRTFWDEEGHSLYLVRHGIVPDSDLTGPGPYTMNMNALPLV